MDLTQVQISEIISKEAQSESGFCSLMGIIINSLTYHEREIIYAYRNRPELQHAVYILLGCD